MCLKLRRTITVCAFGFRRTTLTPKKALICLINTNNRTVQCVTRYPCPMALCRLEQLRQMWLQAIPTSIFAVEAVIAFFQTQKVVVDICQVVKQITQALIFGELRILYL